MGIREPIKAYLEKDEIGCFTRIVFEMPVTIEPGDSIHLEAEIEVPAWGTDNLKTFLCTHNITKLNKLEIERGT